MDDREQIEELISLMDAVSDGMVTAGINLAAARLGKSGDDMDNTFPLVITGPGGDFRRAYTPVVGARRLRLRKLLNGIIARALRRHKHG